MKIAIQGEAGSFSHQAARRMVPGCTVVSCAHSSEVFARVVRRYNDQRLHSALGFLTPADYYRGQPSQRYAARRTKLAQARHQRKEKNLELQQRTLLLLEGEEVASH